ncbi:hypothetical protein FB451DRAFT_1187651 [Mycena latifolia]|nr:hypothetical protein FB451DRAFT_1187651 [Mycena latifolia]
MARMAVAQTGYCRSLRTPPTVQDQIYARTADLLMSMRYGPRAQQAASEEMKRCDIPLRNVGCGFYIRLISTHDSRDPQKYLKFEGFTCARLIDHLPTLYGTLVLKSTEITFCLFLAVFLCCDIYIWIASRGIDFADSLSHLVASANVVFITTNCLRRSFVAVARGSAGMSCRGQNYVINTRSSALFANSPPASVVRHSINGLSSWQLELIAYLLPQSGTGIRPQVVAEVSGSAATATPRGPLFLDFRRTGSAVLKLNLSQSRYGAQMQILRRYLIFTPLPNWAVLDRLGLEDHADIHSEIPTEHPEKLRQNEGKNKPPKVAERECQIE